MKIFLIWNVFGMLGCGTIACYFGAQGMEIANPRRCYELSKMNWFGATVVSLIYNLLCPIGAVCYWIYWLFTVGRKEKK